MNGQFKCENFDKDYFKEFSENLEKQGISHTITWKKNNKTVDESNPKTNAFLLEIEGKWFFKVMKNKGHVRFKNLSDDQERKVLGLLGEYQFYSEPKWGLGIGLIALYLILEFLISSAQDISWFLPAIMIMCGLVLLFLWVAYKRAMEQVSEGVYKACMIFGIPAYLFTAIGSLLTLPLFIAISQHHLTYKIRQIQ